LVLADTCSSSTKHTSELRLLTSRTEFPGPPVAPGIVICPNAEDVVIAREPTAPGTDGTERPVMVLIASLDISKWKRHFSRQKQITFGKNTNIQ